MFLSNFSISSSSSSSPSSSSPSSASSSSSSFSSSSQYHHCSLALICVHLFPLMTIWIRIEITKRTTWVQNRRECCYLHVWSCSTPLRLHPAVFLPHPRFHRKKTYLPLWGLMRVCSSTLKNSSNLSNSNLNLNPNVTSLVHNGGQKTYEKRAAALPKNIKDKCLRKIHGCLIRTLHNYPFFHWLKIYLQFSFQFISRKSTQYSSQISEARQIQSSPISFPPLGFRNCSNKSPRITKNINP